MEEHKEEHKEVVHRRKKRVDYKKVWKFVDKNFIGISILASTIIMSGTLVSIFDSGVNVAPTTRQQTAEVVPTNPTAGGGGVGTRGSAPEIGDAPVLGRADAPVTMVEYSDYECPFCSRFFNDTLAQIKKDYVDTGKVKFVYKDFPLAFHPEAQQSAEAARCVREQLGDAGYWDMHDLLFQNQQSLSIASSKQWARQLGANGSQFDSCLDSGKYASLVKADADDGAALGVSGTPTFFINDVQVVGAVPYAQISSVIESELANTN